MRLARNRLDWFLFTTIFCRHDLFGSKIYCDCFAAVSNLTTLIHERRRFQRDTQPEIHFMMRSLLSSPYSQTTMGDMRADAVSNYLSDNRDFLRRWLLRHADSDWLRRVADEKAGGSGAHSPEVSTAAANISGPRFCDDCLCRMTVQKVFAERFLRAFLGISFQIPDQTHNKTFGMCCRIAVVERLREFWTPRI